VAVVGKILKNRKETAIYKGRNNKQYNIEAQNTQNRKPNTKQENKHKRNIKQHVE
jgi:hypothetical protein